MKYIGLLIVFVLFISCSSYKITRTYVAPTADFSPENCDPMIVKQKDFFGLRVNYHGSITLDDDGNTGNCSENKAIEILRREACHLGANLINIVAEERPSIASTCYRCTAEFLTVEKNEFFFELLANGRKITSFTELDIIDWSLFSNQLPDTVPHPYEIFSTIEALPTGSSFWTGELKSFITEGFYYWDISKVRQSFMTEDNLEHIQMFIYLTPIYAKKLHVYLSTNKSSIRTPALFHEIIKDHITQLYNTKIEYMDQTEYGQNRENQAMWTEKISNLLIEYEIETRK